ncbi:DUF4229 domain-containing protein [Microbacterium sp. MPKO10]|uniref:DUF4229 domain-containing protein n=1 Tax=Microbacterium sp. MPKO10 TaxID=2989818 RepID=UPI0022361B2C|nr:DUF4229 domain-containing protein [Microbacterium sp. MPKO10]MCW4456943.1 DUF4229 domain-containing protein [Microbacterium sp. MPKO10]
MKRIPPALTYTILRLLAFIVPLVILLFLGFNEWFSAIIAAIIGFAFSLIFLQRSRERVAVAIHDRRTGADAAEPHETPTDEEAEDDVIEHGGTDGAGADDEENRPADAPDTAGSSDEAAPQDGTASDVAPSDAESRPTDAATRSHLNDDPSH